MKWEWFREEEIKSTLAGMKDDEVSVRQGFSTSALLMFGPYNSLSWGLFCVFRVFSRIPGFYPLGASKSPPVVTTKMSLGKKNCSVEKLV